MRLPLSAALARRSRARRGSGGGSIPFDSTSLFFDTLEADEFNYPDTAAFNAAFDAKALTLGERSGAVIDDSVLFNGHPTLKLAENISYIYGYRELAAPINRAASRVFFRLSPTFHFINTQLYNQSVSLGSLLDDVDVFELYTDTRFRVEEQSFQIGPIDSSFRRLLSNLRGVWVPLTVYVDATDRTNTHLESWIGADKFLDRVFDSGSSVNGISAVGAVCQVIGGFLPDFSRIGDPANNYVHIGLYENVDRDVYPNPYSGLGSVVVAEDARETVLHAFPAEAIVPQAGTYQFELRDGDNVVVADEWDCTGGVIDNTGLFTAGGADGEFVVTATKDGIDYTSVVEVGVYDITADPDLWSDVDIDAMGAGADVILHTLDDASGNGNGFQQFDDLDSRRPLNRVGVLNGYAVAEGDGVDDLMDSINAVPFGVRTNFVVYRLLSGSTSRHPWVFAGGWERMTRLAGTERWLWYQDVSGGVYQLLDPAQLAADGVWALCTFRLNSALSEDIGVNNSALTNREPTANLWGGPSNQTDRCFAHSGGDSAHSQIGRHVTILRAMTDTEVRQARRSLNAKYRIY